MPARTIHYAESLATANVSTNAFVQVASLTWTNVASKQYFVGGSWGVRVNVTANAIFSQLMYLDVAVTATVGDFSFDPAGDFPDFRIEKREHFALRRVTTPASVGTQTLSLRGRNTTTNTWGEFSNIRLFAIRATAADAYGERNPGIAVGVNTWATHASATFTPATTGTYVVLGHSETRTGAGGNRRSGARITHQATARALEGYQSNETMTFRKNFPLLDIFSCNGAGANTITIDTCCSAAGGTNVSAATGFGCIMALRVDSFASAFAAVSDTTANTSSATYVTALTLATTFSNGGTYGIFAGARYRMQRTAVDISGACATELMISGTTAADAIQMTYGTAVDLGYVPFGFFSYVTGNGAAQDLHFMIRRAASLAQGVDLCYQRIVVLQFAEAPAAPAGGGFKPPWWFHHQTQIYQ